MNIQIITSPTGRSPENKYFFGRRAKDLDFSRPKYNKVGDMEDFQKLFQQMMHHPSAKNHVIEFFAGDMLFNVRTNDERHAQFVRNMFTEIDHTDRLCQWMIWHNTEIEVDEPTIYVNLDSNHMLIAGTTFMGEIKKGVFGILGFELPEQNILPMHCAAFTYNGTRNLMFGLSGTGKTTLSSDPAYQLISDDEVYWDDDGIHMIESGCYAKSEGLSPETHPTIFNAVEKARSEQTLVEENPGAANARLSYPLSCVENAYHEDTSFGHPNNIFFLTMDAQGVLPAVSKISNNAVRVFFETGYTSQMPGTEAGSDEIKKIFSPCYGSPFMPRSVKTYSDMLMKKIDETGANVFLINTGMNQHGERFSLPFTRHCIRTSIEQPQKDSSQKVLKKLLTLI